MVAPRGRIGFVAAHVEDCAFYCDESRFGRVGSCRRELSVLGCRDASHDGREEAR